MSDIEQQGNGWNEWSKHVLKELERLNDNYEGLREQMTTIKDGQVEFKVVKESLIEVKDWKKEMTDVASPIQFKEMRQELADLKTFKIKAVTAVVLLQVVVGIALALKEYLF